MRPIVTLRPQPGTDATVTAGQQLGLTVLGYPMWDVRPREWVAPDPTSFDVLLIGSGNALLHGGEQLESLKQKPVFAVGQRTAEVARQRGFNLGVIGSGGLQQLIDATPPHPIRFLRLAGAEHLPLVRPSHVRIDLRIVYETLALEASAKLADVLAGGSLVLLHSAAAARHFAAECDRLKLDRSKIALASLGPRIAAAAGTGWALCESAPQPNDAALLALARDMGY